MTVKRTFFITEEEAKTLRETLKDKYITHRFPCYELEDGKMVYAKEGWPEGPSTWYEAV